MDNNKIAILSPIISFTSMYSVSQVILGQCDILEKNGYLVTLFVTDACLDNLDDYLKKRITVRRVLPYIKNDKL